ncbi:hypothetical protein [Mycolicibacterium tokaiense]|uniref:Uncharacterized protein n=1 Tax=Mycolicibacterium tokaiense TaxID=39695 RepID=A0A378TH59_9MYCO|nr:hypothetical protein [Mycolicibacterium tokaiense]BBY85983.1 hypothetical protein MTOK_17650 [Mycolicibacterium tokaiense]STZ59507.1 Uncharacterised protein [Mycolicibacterium tokaiense]
MAALPTFSHSDTRHTAPRRHWRCASAFGFATAIAAGVLTLFGSAPLAMAAPTSDNQFAPVNTKAVYVDVR